MTYIAYYLVDGNRVVAGPFATVEHAVHGKAKFIPPAAALLTVVKSTIEAEPV